MPSFETSYSGANPVNSDTTDKIGTYSRGSYLERCKLNERILQSNFAASTNVVDSIGTYHTSFPYSSTELQQQMATPFQNSTSTNIQSSYYGLTPSRVLNSDAKSLPEESFFSDEILKSPKGSILPNEGFVHAFTGIGGHQTFTSKFEGNKSTLLSTDLGLINDHGNYNIPMPSPYISPYNTQIISKNHNARSVSEYSSSLSPYTSGSYASVGCNLIEKNVESRNAKQIGPPSRVLQPSLKHNTLNTPSFAVPIQCSDEKPRKDENAYSNQMNFSRNLKKHSNSTCIVPRIEITAEDDTFEPNKVTTTDYNQSHQYSTCDKFSDDLQNIRDMWKQLPLVELGKGYTVNELMISATKQDLIWSVIKIENLTNKKIPYNLDDEMLGEFLGKNIGLLPEEYGGVHIIMDRTTGKTMDCFLEFTSLVTAERFLQRRSGNNRRCVLGNRHISIELVKRGELMKWLFPKVRGMQWRDDGTIEINAIGTMAQKVEIISREELVMILGHARTPHRSPFSRKCLQRPYESLMSIVTKFPWHETTLYTLKQRDLVFQACFEAGELLKRQILRGKAGPNLDLKLLRRLCRVISCCPGFTLRQKIAFLDEMGISTGECFTILGALGASHPLATQFQALTVKAGADFTVLETTARLIAIGISTLGEGSDNRRLQKERLDVKVESRASFFNSFQLSQGPTGPIHSEVVHAAEDSELTMKEGADVELRHVLDILIQAVSLVEDTE